MDDDQRLAPGAYLTDGFRLYTVMSHDRMGVLLENCASGCKLSILPASIGSYRLVKPAPAAPDYPEPIDQGVPA